MLLVKLGSVVALVGLLLGFGLIAAMTGDWNVAVVDLGFVALAAAFYAVR